MDTASEAPCDARILVERPAGKVTSIAVLISSMIASYLRSQETRRVHVFRFACVTWPPPRYVRCCGVWRGLALRPMVE